MRVVVAGALASAGQKVWPWWTNGYGWPWALFWLGFALLFWASLIAILVWAVRSASASRRKRDSLIQMLNRGLSAGDISQDEYERVRRLLEI